MVVLLSGVILLLCVVVTITVLPTPVMAAGENGPFIEAGTRNQAMKFSAQQMLLGCINTGNLDDLSGGRTRDTIAIGGWMNNRNTLMHVGFFDEPDDGTFGCAPGGDAETTAGIENHLLGVLGTLGWSDSIAAYCAFGAVGKNGQPCGQGTYGFDKPPNYDTAKTAIASKNNGQLYTLSDAARYAADWKAISTICKPTDGIEVESLANAGTKKEGGAAPVEGRLVARIINKDGTESVVSFAYDKYTGSGFRSGPIHAFALNSHNGAGIGFSTCRDVVNDLNANASAYKVYMTQLLKTNPNPDGETNEESPKNINTCAVDWIGWMVCGVSWAIAGFVGFAYKVMKFFIEIPLISTQTTNKNTIYTAWSTMRNIANVVFVGLFIIMIYSQITGGGKK